jgi:hypothetical protein
MNGKELNRGSLAAGVAFIVIGLAFLLEALNVWDIKPEVLWPSTLIAIGGALLIGAPTRRTPPSPPVDTPDV